MTTLKVTVYAKPGTNPDKLCYDAKLVEDDIVNPQAMFSASVFRDGRLFDSNYTVIDDDGTEKRATRDLIRKFFSTGEWVTYGYTAEKSERPVKGCIDVLTVRNEPRMTFPINLSAMTEGNTGKPIYKCSRLTDTGGYDSWYYFLQPDNTVTWSRDFDDIDVTYEPLSKRVQYHDGVNAPF